MSDTASATVDPDADDPLEPGAAHSNSSRSSVNGAVAKVVIPAISIRSEYPSISRRGRKGKQAISAMVTVEMPSAGERGKYPTPVRPVHMSRSVSENLSPPLPPSPKSLIDQSLHDFGSPLFAKSPSAPSEDFAYVLSDLRTRLSDYKASGLDQLGPLRLFDLLRVRKGPLIREFYVYLFRDALICISEEKKHGTIRGMFSTSSGSRSSNSESLTGRGVLKLKGRIYLRHVRSVIDTSMANELSLNITMEDEATESFVLMFKDKNSIESWWSNLNRSLEDARPHDHATQSASKIAKLMGDGAPAPRRYGTKASGVLASPSTPYMDLHSPVSEYTGTPGSSTFSPATSPLNGLASPGDLRVDQPLAPVHTPIDLVIILSLPAPNTNSTLPLKVRLMRSSLAFVLSLLGPRDRLSLVACEMGSNGTVRKTPFLNTTRNESRKRLETFIDGLGSGRSVNDPIEAQTGPVEKQDVVTAVNVALDVILQRKVKNSLSGMILISDTADVIKRAQMDLVTARLDAANIPVHALGYGKAHDPSPLWMISNHTNGTYTFVKEWYHLRNTLAGVIGGLLSIALTNMKLHLSCQENDFKVTKISGSADAIVSISGKDVDIDLHELRFGERRDLIIELDIEGLEDHRHSSDGSEDSLGQSHTVASDPMSHADSIRHAPSTVGGFSSAMDTLSISDANALRDNMYEDALIDEVPVVEVDCSFTDPAAGRSVTRLTHPVLLTVAVLPHNARASSAPADPSTVRRRMELLTTDMLTRTMLLASRKKFGQAVVMLRETRRIVDTMVETLKKSAHGQRSRLIVERAVESLTGAMNDVDTLLDGLEEHREMYERDHRNYAAQQVSSLHHGIHVETETQAVVLRTQRAWTTRSLTERQYCTKEVQQMVALSAGWSGD